MRIRIGLVLLMLVSLASGSFGQDRTESLRVAVELIIRTLDPARASGPLSREIIGNTYDRLVEYDPGTPGSHYGLLAESWTVWPQSAVGVHSQPMGPHRQCAKDRCRQHSMRCRPITSSPMAPRFHRCGQI